MDSNQRKYLFISIIVILAFSLGFVASSYAAKPRWACPVCSYSGGEITSFVNEDYPEVVMREINGAQSSIDIILYEMKFYETNNSVRQLEDALISAHNRGIEVRILLDQSEWAKRITDLTKENWKTKEYLEENGLTVKLDSLKETTHTKLVIVDGRTVILGSTNWGFSAFERNNEVDVMLKESRAAEYYNQYFEYMWDLY